MYPGFPFLSLVDFPKCPPHTDKKENQIFSYMRKSRMEQLQSHIWLTASSYMGKYLRISSYIRKPFLIFDFANAKLWISLYMRKILFSFLSVHTECRENQRVMCSFPTQSFNIVPGVAFVKGAGIFYDEFRLVRPKTRPPGKSALLPSRWQAFAVCRLET
jgi:hypothetical protein